ncbi:MAG: hypothetical protein ACK2U1_09810, partial [Anaerolineales bacterium]
MIGFTLLLVLVPFLLSWVIQFQRIPVLSWGYWLSLLGLASSFFFEPIENNKRPDQLDKYSAAFRIIAGTSMLLLIFSVTNSLIVYSRTKTSPIALVNGNLIDGTGSGLLEEAIILIKDGNIRYIGTNNAGIIPPEYNVVDLGGNYVLPGLINSHVHQGYIPANLENWAWAGVTSVCDLGAPITFPFHLARELLKPFPKLAQLGTAGPILTSIGGYPVAEHNLPSLMIGSGEDASHKTRLLVELHPDLVKIALESRYGEELLLEQAKQVVSIAHKNSKPVAAHLGNINDLEKALTLGVDSIHHMIHEEIPNRIIQAMVDQELLWVPTMEVMYFFY